MKNFKGDYYVGFDIGTDSVGYATTDTDYNLCKFKGNAMWGIDLFEESNSAAERRTFRSARRRGLRKRNRIEWLQMLFDEEISKVDNAFFQRLKESCLYLEDKSSNVPYAVFADSNYTDKEFHTDYPTIYRLRKELIESSQPHDVRLVYLALHHIIKHRGHFLFDNMGSDFESESSFETLFDDLKLHLKEEYDIEFECNDLEEFSKILKDKILKKTAKSSKSYQLFGYSKKNNLRETAVIDLMCGRKVKFSDMFGDKSFDNEEVNGITFESGYDDNENTYRDLLQEKFELIEKAKAVYDWAILADILNGEKYISFAKVKTYEEHDSDLQTLKYFVKKRCKPLYDEIFRITKDKLDNYTAYCGKYKENGKNGVIIYRPDVDPQDKFCKYLKKKFEKLDKTGYEEMFDKIENGTFMPKIVVKDNGVIPMQVNRSELKAILKNASTYLDFLNKKDENGISVSDKIVKIFEFRIPYYVGPLNSYSPKSWLVRSDEKIYPWNFENVVDIEQSAENFINNLTSKCTYLPTKDVIPKNSILYSAFTVLNELNNLRLDGKKPDISLKQAIFNDLFMTHKKVRRKDLLNYIKAEEGAAPDITGIDGDFKSSMRSAIEMSQFNLTDSEKEDVIKAITVFGDDKKLLRKRLKRQFASKLSDEDIMRISKLKYKDWGRLSKEFLTEIYDVDKSTGELKFNIIHALWQTNDNLMELLGSKYNFEQSRQNYLDGIQAGQSLEKMVENLYISPAVKRPVYQSLKIMQEINKIQGHAPKKIFVEMTRKDGVKGDKGRKDSRKNKLIDLYKKCGEDSGELWESLEKTPDDEFKRDRLYFYYTQFGKCMYTGEPINLSELYNKNIYDVDHIFPRSKVKDDSLDNRVLVKKQVNDHKDNTYPLDSSIHEKMKGFWHLLMDKGLISKKKYERLTRVTPLSDSELSDFIARQIVETSQSTKAVASLFKELYPDTEIVYVKASTVSEFRHEYDFLKCREVNDFHHAKDAYLNIVVGNVYNERCTHNRSIFIEGLKTKAYSLNKMFSFDTPNAWSIDDNKSIKIVRKTMNKNNIRFTRYALTKNGGLFKMKPLKKGSGQVSLKQNSPLSDISKYGGYDKPTSSYFSFVKYEGKKGKEMRQLVAIDSYIKTQYEANPEKYLSETLGLKNPVVLIPVVKYNACIEIDGFRMHISSKSNGGKTIVCKPAMQLTVGYDKEVYIKNIIKFNSQPENHKVSELDHITAEENIELFDLLTNKMTNTIFKVKFGSIGSKIESHREQFVNLDLRKQCFVLAEILKIMHANVVIGDLSFIGESKQSGTVSTNSVLSEIKGVKSIYLVHQSVTGLYEKKIDLLNM